MDLSRCYSSFSMIQTVAKWAGVFGAVQSVIWIILSIISILMFFCIFDFDPKITYGSITSYVIFELYFRGDCQPDNLQYFINFDVLRTVQTVFGSHQILVWTCVYMAMSLVWLVSSCLLFTHVKKNNINITIAVLATWAGVTGIICCMDFSLGVIFGIDFGRFQHRAYSYNVLSGQSGPVNSDGVQLVSGEFAAIFMMLIALKGFILWIINFCLMVYVLIAAIVAQSTVHDFVNHTFNATHATPINAFDTKDDVGFDNAAFVVEQRPRHTPITLNEDPIKRAARMSTENLQERRFRNIDSFEQYPPPRPQQQQPEMNNEPPFPTPDYTPPMSRNNNQNGQIRHSRYQ